MIVIKTPTDIFYMKQAGKLAAKLLAHIGSHIKEGIHTQYLNEIAEQWAKQVGVQHAPLNYNGYPKSICTSVNNVVCHGIPSSKTILKNGDIINVDITIIREGYYGDTSKTFMVGEVVKEASILVQRAEKAMWAGINSVKPGGYLSDVGNAIANYIELFNYGIVTQLGGHGIGKQFHEDPYVAHDRQQHQGPLLKPGMTFTIEPMINEGSSDVTIDKEDGWTVYTKDHTLSSQFEHTVLVTNDGVEVLTAM